MVYRKTFIKKAFTLVELLAVIVILGIILLIAIPKITNIIDKANEESRVLSVKGFGDAAKIAVDKYKLSNTAPVNLSDLTIETTHDNVDCLHMNYDEEAGVVLRECLVNNYDKKYYYVDKKVYDNVETYDSVIIDNGYDSELLAGGPILIASTDLTPGTFSGLGTSLDPYLIEGVEDVVALSKNVNSGNTYSGKYFSLTLSLDFKKTKSYVNSLNTDYGDINGNGQIEGLLVELTTLKGFLPIGNSVNKFSGIISGNNYSLNNLYINRTDSSYIGFVGYNSGIIKNLVFNEAAINGIDNVGIVAGYNDEHIIDVEAQGNVTGNNYVGLIAGRLGNGNGNKAIGVIAKGNVSGANYVGGLTGHIGEYPVLKGVFLEGTVTGTGTRVNRITGQNYYGTVRAYSLKTNLLNGSAISSTVITNESGSDINDLTEVTNDINTAEEVLDTYIGGDNDSDGYYWDYNESGTLVEKNVTTSPLTFTLSGAGTTVSPYQINSYEDLKQATQKLNMIYSINNDIDLSGKKFYKFGGVANNFTGKILGNQHTISNMQINTPSASYIGFSGYNDGIIQNLTFTNATVVGCENVGIAAGLSTKNIIDVETYGNVVGTNFAGLTAGRINSGLVVGVIAKGNVSGGNYVGGFTGYIGENPVLRGIFLDGTVTGTGSRVKRTVGYNYYGVVRAYALKTNLLNGVAISSTVVTSENGSDINYLTDVTNDINTADAVLDTYIGGDNDSDGYYWDYNESGTLVEKSVTTSPLTFSLSGAGTAASPYQINNYEGLKQATQKLNMIYSINNDIDLSGKKFYMFGSVANSFTGKILGNQHIISNMQINTPKASYIGFSGYNSGIIQNLTLNNVNIVGCENIGIVVGYNDEHIIDVEVQGDVTGVNYVGLIAGRLGNGNGNKAIGVIAKGNVTGVNNVGGLTGYIGEYPILKGIYLEGTVTGTGSEVKRIVGRNYYGTVSAYALKTNLLKGVAISSTNINSENGADINSINDILTNINTADLVLDTSIGGDNDADGYYWDYNESSVLIEKPAA